jgi:DNA polymerase III subunit gamma/tau
MSYVVIARRYRPQQFEDIVGQEHITRTLSNSIANNRIGQAFIFSGPRGVGKTTTARILAMALNCENGPMATPDINSPICQAIILGKSMDVMEIDGASNRRIEEIRNLRENINYTPSEGRYRIYIIDEVHMLTNEAFNALLKTLEEPPAHAIFIFATTEIHRVPATILSRCQRFDFKRIPINIIISHLKGICESEKIDIDDDALMQIAKKADGSMRDSQSILDQIISFSGQKIRITDIEQAIGIINQDVFFNISDKIKEQNLKEILLLSRELFTTGIDLTELMLGLEEHFRNMLVCAAMKSVELIETSDNFTKKYKEQIDLFSESDLIAYLNIISQTLSEMKWAQQPYLKFELALVKMAKMPTAKSTKEILEKLDLLKKKQLNKPAVPYSHDLTLQTPVLNIESIKNKWPEVTEKVHGSKPTLANIFELFNLTGFLNDVLKVDITCNEGHKSLIEKDYSFITEILQKIFKTKIKLDINFNVQKTEPGALQKNNANKRKEKIKKLETLKTNDPLFKQFVDEFGLELE